MIAGLIVIAGMSLIVVGLGFMVGVMQEVLTPDSPMTSQQRLRFIVSLFIMLIGLSLSVFSVFMKSDDDIDCDRVIEIDNVRYIAEDCIPIE